MPFSTQFEDVYYARQDAAGESKHVFLQGNRLAERWSAAGKPHETFAVAELGFGAGLNFMLCWQLWSQSHQRRNSCQKLHYIAYEKFPIRKTDLARIHQQWPGLNKQSQQLLAVYRCDCHGLYRLALSDDVILDLIIGDAHDALEQRHPQDRKIDAWFLDGFAPDRNPQMWSAELFIAIARHSHAHTTLATYSSAGDVRRNLRDAGFQVHKVPGFAGKRHMLIANGTREAQTSKTDIAKHTAKPWFHLPPRATNNKEAIVVGAGLAGCHAARALARRNWQVRILEQEPEFSSGVNAIPQLALRCRLFNQVDTQAQLLLQAYRYAVAEYQRLQENSDCGWHDCGLWQFADALNKRNPLKQETIANLYPESIVDAATSSTLFKHNDNKPGYWFADGGWANPELLCHRLIASENITVRLNTPVTNIKRLGDSWQLLHDNTVCDEAAIVILASGAGLTNLEQTALLPLELTTGQCTLLPAQSPLDQLNQVICGSRTIFPAASGIQTLAASYSNANNPTSQHDEDAQNLAKLAGMMPGSELPATVLDSRTALRVNTRDRLPLVGPLADLPAMARQYAGLSRNARQLFNEPGHYHTGLYVSAGHGSNGLSTSALAGEYLASLICGDSLPLDRQSAEAINPCRFLIQDLKKQREI